MLMFMKIDDVRSKLRKYNYKMFRLRPGEKQGSRMESNVVFNKIIRLRNRINEVVTSEQDPTQLSFRLVKKKIKEEFRALCGVTCL